MKILGTKQESLIEWPGKVSYVIFLGDCNFKCPFCYVPHLVFPEEKTEEISQNKILKDIKERKDFIDAVCITGGEPTINPKLPDFLENIKNQNLGIKIRLETNGSNPDMLAELIENKLIDSIALDIKNCKEKYNETCGTEVNLQNIEKTIQLIKNSDIDYEFRTTLVPGLHTKEDIEKIANWLSNLNNKKIKLYVLNQFKTDLPREQLINPEFIKKGDYPQDKMENIKKHLESLNLFEKIEIRI